MACELWEYSRIVGLRTIVHERAWQEAAAVGKARARSRVEIDLLVGVHLAFSSVVMVVYGKITLMSS